MWDSGSGVVTGAAVTQVGSAQREPAALSDIRKRNGRTTQYAEQTLRSEVSLGIRGAWVSAFNLNSGYCPQTTCFFELLKTG